MHTERINKQILMYALRLKTKLDFSFQFIHRYISIVVIIIDQSSVAVYQRSCLMKRTKRDHRSSPFIVLEIHSPKEIISYGSMSWQSSSYKIIKSVNHLISVYSTEWNYLTNEKTYSSLEISKCTIHFYK